MVKEKLNISHLHWGFPPIIGGVETHLSIMLPTMVEFGHSVSLLTGSTEGAKAQDSYKGVDIIRTPLMDLNWLYKRGLGGLEEEIEAILQDFINKVNPDIIHTHNMHYFSKIHAQILASIANKKKIPLVLTAHNVWDDILFLELARKIKWTHIIAVSHFIKKELIGVGCDHHKITVIHHGIDTEIFRPDIDTSAVRKKFPELDKKLIVFHPARVGLAKGADVSIKALNIVKNVFPNCLLVLAGTKNIIDWGGTQQKDIAYLVDLVKIFKLRRNVLIDVFSLEEMAQIYAFSRVIIYPSSVGEPFGLTMLEAMATAKPMIVTDSGGMPEIIRDGINGFVIPIKDFEVLASRIIQLFNDENFALRLGATGRQMAEAYYTKEAVAKNTLGVYQRILK
jgi:glycosyltransferase involved in cell wall biosynthesis